jgi:hypothetical protein
MTSVSTLLTYWHAYGGNRPTLEEFRAELATLPKVPLVVTCGVLNAFLRGEKSGSPIDISAHDALSRAFLPKHLADKLLKHPTGSLPDVVFNRQGLMFVAKEALLYASDDESLALENQILGKIFLMANDYMHFEDLAKRSNCWTSSSKLQFT